MLKYRSLQTSFSSVDSEISVAIEITNCPHKCDGCHSPELCEDIGSEICPDNIEMILLPFMDFYAKPLFTCIVFMGGDHDSETLVNILERCKKSFPKVKLCLYTGSEYINPKIFNLLNYLKVGKYNKELGGLDSKNTNQRFIRIKEGVTHGSIFSGA